MRRREFLTLLAGGALVATPARAQRQGSMPIVGLLSSRSQSDSGHVIDEFRRGLGESGYVEGQNVTVDYRWADGDYARLPILAADLVHLQVAVIATTGGVVSARAAKAATSTIPIVFTAGDDPVRHGLVERMNRPGGNATGVLIIATDLGSKRLELLHELVPSAKSIAALINPGNPNIERQSEDLRQAAGKLGVRLHLLSASNETEIEKAFDDMRAQGAKALLVGADPFLHGRRQRIVALAARDGLPAIYESPEYAEDGGLISYGASRRVSSRLLGAYVGRILAGASPGELPVQAPTRLEMVINLKAASALGLQIPPLLLARADEVIE
jgi:putative ABC transport system substrate-binding protein